MINKMKRIILCVITLCLIGMLVPKLAVRAEASGAFEYTILEDNTVELTKYLGSETSVYIPDRIDGKEVTSIGANISPEVILTYVKIPEGITNIDDAAFSNCDSTMWICAKMGSYAAEWAETHGFQYVEDNSLTIDYSPWTYVMMKGDRLKITGFYEEYEEDVIDSEGKVSIPGTIKGFRVTALAASLFENNSDVVAVDIGEGIEIIEGKAFYNCSALTTVDLPSTLKTIGDEAFCLCRQLTTMEIPQNVSSIGGGAFWYTEWLDQLRLANSDTPLIVNKSFLDASLWIDYDENGLMITEEAYVIPEDVSEVCAYAFYAPENSEATEPKGNESIKSIAFANPNTTIAPAAFYGFSSLEKITLPENLETLEERTFAECTSLKSVEIPDGVSEIADDAFLNCSSLEEITLPSSLETIGSNAFAGTVNEDGDSNLTITIPEDLNIENLNVENIINIQYITINVAEGSPAYIYLQECDNVVIHTYPPQTPQEPDLGKEETSGTEDEQPNEETNQTTEQPVEKKKVRIGKTYTYKKLKYKVTSSKNVTFVGTTSKKMKKVTIPAKVTILNRSFKVTAIGKRALKKYSKLEVVVVGSNVKIIGDEAFMKCTRLKKITIGKNVKTIGKKAFYGDKKLKKMIFKGTKVTKIGKKAMKGVSGVKVKVPTDKSKKKYAKLLRKAK